MFLNWRHHRIDCTNQFFCCASSVTAATTTRENTQYVSMVKTVGSFDVKSGQHSSTTMAAAALGLPTLTDPMASPVPALVVYSTSLCILLEYYLQWKWRVFAVITKIWKTDELCYTCLIVNTNTMTLFQASITDSLHWYELDNAIFLAERLCAEGASAWCEYCVAMYTVYHRYYVLLKMTTIIPRSGLYRKVFFYSPCR